MDDANLNRQYSPEEIIKQGEGIYFSKKEELEKDHYGQFVVIDVDSKEIFTDADKLKAIEMARNKFPNKLFYIAQIGNLKQPANSSINELKKYDWSF